MNTSTSSVNKIYLCERLRDDALTVLGTPSRDGPNRRRRYCSTIAIMGIDEDGFVELVDSISKRTACDGVLGNPISTPYGGIFCSDCMFASVVDQATCANVGVDMAPTDLRQGTAQFYHATSDMSVRDFRRRGCIELVHGDKRLAVSSTVHALSRERSCSVTRAISRASDAAVVG